MTAPPLRNDQLAPGQHVKDMGGGWVDLSAEFIAAMCSKPDKKGKK